MTKRVKDVNYRMKINFKKYKKIYQTSILVKLIDFFFKNDVNNTFKLDFYV